MTPGPGTLALLAVLGGAAALDGTSLGQVMVSRPLVAATLAGCVAGSPAHGAMLGLFLEALHLGVLPVGASRYPEGGPPAVAGAALFAGSAGTFAELLPVVLFCMAWEWACGATVQWMRHWNARAASPPEETELDPATLERRHYASIAGDFARGAVLTLLGLALLAAWLRAGPAEWTPEPVARMALAGVAAAGIASSLRLFGSRRLPLFVLGAACGVALLVLR
ncbi:MAG: phosphotransferase system sorbose-specific subunit [Gemmatimonadetes bacterium]|nr:phosphotransferase system sorbose-specific subunit [Gemmatimonadota bacterium]